MAADQDDRRSAEEKNGAVKTLLGEALGKAMMRQQAQQFSLFDAGDPLQADEAGAELATERGPGRPPGARNKATEELRAWARQRFGDPGLKLMERVFADPKALAEALAAPSAWDVYKAQSEWMLRLLPFFWAAMPAELKIAATRHLALSISSTPGGPAGDRELSADPLTALLQFQRLSESADAQLHVMESHAEPTFDDGTEG